MTKQFKIPDHNILWPFTDNRTCLWFQNTTSSTARADIDFYRLFPWRKCSTNLPRFLLRLHNNRFYARLSSSSNSLISSALEGEEKLSFRSADLRSSLLWPGISAVRCRTGVYVNLFHGVTVSTIVTDLLLILPAWVDSTLHWHACAYF